MSQFLNPTTWPQCLQDPPLLARSHCCVCGAECTGWEQRQHRSAHEHITALVRQEKGWEGTGHDMELSGQTQQHPLHDRMSWVHPFTCTAPLVPAEPWQSRAQLSLCCPLFSTAHQPSQSSVLHMVAVQWQLPHCLNPRSQQKMEV